ncbi:hypothetical protein PPYR_05523 [Photinus pyralis]|uniref:UPF0547 domain-containing protein n=1 Tax=Photinus pyralis TaxID=7054 RepID=A0A1Y1LRU3_PHOPY|nr:UPF0547 protein C16orf87 homolog [Photinus pyralis]KAB0801169.1 hypothetical protein PPYR_05523 [Photinus pyralis]
MPKHKMIAKGCPKCDQQVPVACKACPCGHSFFNARRNSRALSPGEDLRRRTQRVRREKPNYYDSLEYDKQIKKVKLRNSECEDDDRKDLVKSKRRRFKKEEDEEEEPIAPLTAEKQLQCSIILAEINRKLQLVTWKPS